GGEWETAADAYRPGSVRSGDATCAPGATASAEPPWRPQAQKGRPELSRLSARAWVAGEADESPTRLPSQPRRPLPRPRPTLCAGVQLSAVPEPRPGLGSPGPDAAQRSRNGARKHR